MIPALGRFHHSEAGIVERGALLGGKDEQLLANDVHVAPRESEVPWSRLNRPARLWIPSSIGWAKDSRLDGGRRDSSEPQLVMCLAYWQIRIRGHSSL
jgi:hypothetical protein